MSSLACMGSRQSLPQLLRHRYTVSYIPSICKVQFRITFLSLESESHSSFLPYKNLELNGTSNFLFFASLAFITIKKFSILESYVISKSSLPAISTFKLDITRRELKCFGMICGSFVRVFAVKLAHNAGSPK